MRKLIYLICVVVVALCLTNNSSYSQNSSYKYDKNGYFQFATDSGKIYWIEECTSESGNGCAQASGAFRTDVTEVFKKIWSKL